MASGPIMLVPMCLVENKDEQMSVNEKALKILYKISQPVVVVAIVGLYRTGKSYLMNCLAREKCGFPLGSTVQSETKGIWMWCVPHPSKPNHTLVLLDTEGLGDVAKGDPKNDSWIFALAVLLSSTFIYNSMSTINNDALEKLHYVTELTELIRAKSSPRHGGVEDATEFVSFFPDFIWVVRDFTLELKLNGHPITEDEYLENSLKLIPGLNPKAKISNIPRECIRRYFPKRKCFVFDRPTQDTSLLAKIENILESQLDPKFRQQSDNFCYYIFTHAKTKILREGVKVTGNRLGTLVMTYVDTINKGSVPCLENAVTTLAQLENSATVQKAADHYSEQMGQRVIFPTDTLQELLDLHAACEREAIAIFLEHSFKDDQREFQKKLMEIIKNKKESLLLKNEEASEKYCQYVLDQLSMALMATEVFQRFLTSQVSIEKSILQADKALTQGEKAIAEERAKKEQAEKEQEWLRQKHKEQQQQIEAQNRSLEENIVQLRKKLEKDRDEALREQTRILEHKLKIQEELLNEGFKKKSDEMEAEINRLKNLIESTKKDKTPLIARALDTLADELSATLAIPGKLIGKGLNALSSLFK